MDRPVIGQEGTWMRLNLGHLITIGTLVIGFLITAQQVKDQVGGVQVDVGDLKTSLKTIEGSINSNAITLTGMNDAITDLKKTATEHERHMEASDTQINALQSITKTLDTNMQLINQQLSFLSTSRSMPLGAKK